MTGPPDAAVLTLAALRVPGVGAGRLRSLRDTYGSLSAGLAGAASGGPVPPAFPAPLFRRLPVALDLASAHRALAAASGAGVEALCWDDAAYPAPLWQSGEAPPPLLFVRGRLPHALASPAWRVRAAAVVGTRKATARGLALARELARSLAELRVVVVSGLALGIDGAAHEGALDGRWPTVAVLGGGHGHLHPPSHRSLAERIVRAGGAVLSEHLPDVAPEAHSFPERNRLISGLSRLVVIVEAGIRSGTNATARYALEQHRDVFACPGRPGDPTVAGTLKLIRDGAHPVTELEDVLWRFRLQPAGRPPEQRARGAGTRPDDALLAVLYRLDEATLDELASALTDVRAARDAGAPAAAGARVPGVADLTARLTRLELRGAVVRTAAGRYRLPALERERRAARAVFESAAEGEPP